jgi:hypothetical protein
MAMMPLLVSLSPEIFLPQRQRGLQMLILEPLLPVLPMLPLLMTLMTTQERLEAEETRQSCRTAVSHQLFLCRAWQQPHF